MATKKMLLLPSDAFPRLNNPTQKKLSNLDTKMQEILARDDLAEYDKSKLYQQTLLEYLKLRKDVTKPTEVPIVEETLVESSPRPSPKVQQQQEPPEDDFEAEVISTVPETYKTKASKLLKTLKNMPDLSWNNKGEMVLKGRVYSGSHYVDLINDLLRHRKTAEAPVGWEALSGLLGKLNVPQEVIGNKERQAYIRQARASPRGSRLAANFPHIEEEGIEKATSKTYSRLGNTSPIPQPMTWDYTGI